MCECESGKSGKTNDTETQLEHWQTITQTSKDTLTQTTITITQSHISEHTL